MNILRDSCKIIDKIADSHNNQYYLMFDIYDILCLAKFCNCPFYFAFLLCFILVNCLLGRAHQIRCLDLDTSFQMVMVLHLPLDMLLLSVRRDRGHFF